MPDAPVRLLIVDDSALYRLAIRHALQDLPDVTIVGVAKDGVDALHKIEEFDTDLLTLDVQMPNMNGIEVLEEMNRLRLRPKAIMVSSLTARGAQATTDALLAGAFDFILKPSSPDSAENRRMLKEALVERITAFRQNDPDIGRMHPNIASGPATGSSRSTDCSRHWLGRSLLARGLASSGPMASPEPSQDTP